ncbi:hypothetical protein ISN44_As11g034470 [Arabidopsis suecica]|uniref:Uncharacterized protein n=1 Tax=Arabidopsis suecica TaxID=45249 RepID=A0A8T1ZH49_ARASU|nr:hypothetical protein ISN44_As11g034470 [Arabidopsis suecica]
MSSTSKAWMVATSIGWMRSAGFEATETDKERNGSIETEKLLSSRLMRLRSPELLRQIQRRSRREIETERDGSGGEIWRRRRETVADLRNNRREKRRKTETDSGESMEIVVLIIEISSMGIESSCNGYSDFTMESNTLRLN